jgi:lipopolysaccharide transport system permease protein
VSSSVLIAMMFWFGIVPSLNLLVLPLIVVLAVWGAFAFGVWLSAANSLYRDITFILPFFIQIGFFVSVS